VSDAELLETEHRYPGCGKPPERGGTPRAETDDNHIGVEICHVRPLSFGWSVLTVYGAGEIIANRQKRGADRRSLFAAPYVVV
jgi:hypothetical protein